MSYRINCSNCGKTFSINHFNSTTPLAKSMRTESLCFDCAFWTDYIACPKPDTVIISGKLYFFKPVERKLNLRFLGRRGLLFARNLQTGKVVWSSENRYIATVPKHFQETLPDQYKFISARTYGLMLQRMHKECLAKGCWDRYHCFWYNAAKAEPKTPWNEIPSYHKPGDEQCESFINKETMYLQNKTQ